MVGAYYDSGVLIKSYCHEDRSMEVSALLQAERLPLPLTHFQEAELRNGIRLKLFRWEISAVDASGALADLDEDIRFGRFVRPAYSLPSVFLRAEGLSAAHSETIGARTLDILHVAAAAELQASYLVSFDQRQRALAKKAGLRVLPNP